MYVDFYINVCEYIYIYMYTYICVCVCMCVSMNSYIFHPLGYNPILLFLFLFKISQLWALGNSSSLALVLFECLFFFFFFCLHLGHMEVPGPRMKAKP